MVSKRCCDVFDEPARLLQRAVQRGVAGMAALPAQGLGVELVDAQARQHFGVELHAEGPGPPGVCTSHVGRRGGWGTWRQSAGRGWVRGGQSSARARRACALGGAAQCLGQSVRTSLRASRGSGCSHSARASWYRAWSAWAGCRFLRPAGVAQLQAQAFGHVAGPDARRAPALCSRPKASCRWCMRAWRVSAALGASASAGYLGQQGVRQFGQRRHRGSRRPSRLPIKNSSAARSAGARRRLLACCCKCAVQAAGRGRLKCVRGRACSLSALRGRGAGWPHSLPIARWQQRHVALPILGTIALFYFRSFLRAF